MNTTITFPSRIMSLVVAGVALACVAQGARADADLVQFRSRSVTLVSALHDHGADRSDAG